MTGIDWAAPIMINATPDTAAQIAIAGTGWSHRDHQAVAAAPRIPPAPPAAMTRPTWNFSQPIEDNVGEAVTGTKGQLALKLFGKDLKTLDEKGDEVTAAMAHVPGLVDLKFFHTLGQSLQILPEKLERQLT